VLEKLIRRADVMIVNFPPPARERLKLGWEDIEPINPRPVYCSLTVTARPAPTAIGRLRRDRLFRAVGHP
jgi:formyl-CoA transferase